jgi:2-polyprenyl-3-methyl-5-hydroxy-6-metoxy-1,4-benzoquinol methylase
MIYDETYFKSLNYSGYLEREDRYKKTAKELFEYLKKNKFLNETCSILDYGCAVGFLVKGFRAIGINCEGYDISEWAKSYANKLGIVYIEFSPREFDLLISLDVFEHMTDEEIVLTLKNFKSKYIIFRIPCSTDGGKTFHLEISRRDVSHINCKTKKQWVDFFKKEGFAEFIPLDLYTIYDSSGVMCGIMKNVNYN